VRKRSAARPRSTQLATDEDHAPPGRPILSASPSVRVG
jgi:hypothetical protein